MGILDKATFSFTLNKANKSFANGNYKKALSGYLKILKSKQTSSDDELVKIYINIAKAYTKLEPLLEDDKFKNMDRASNYHIKAAQLYSKLKKHPEAAIEFSSAANCFETLGNFEDAAKYDEQAALMYSEIGKIFEASHTLLEAAEYYEKLKNFSKAAKLFEMAGQLNVKLDDNPLASQNYDSAARCYGSLEDYQKALDYYNLSAGLAGKAGDYLKLAEFKQKLGWCYEKLSDYPNAIENYLKAAELFEKNRKKQNSVLSFMDVGRCYVAKGDMQNSINYYLKADKIASEVNDFENQAILQKEIAACHEQSGDAETAIKYYTNASSAAEKARKPFLVVESQRKVIDLSVKLAEGDKEAGDYEKAGSRYLSAAEGYETLKDYEKAAELYFQRGKFKSKAGNSDKARESFTKAAELYVKSKDFENAIKSYLEAGNYPKAAQFFEKRGNDFVAQADHFNAALRYKQASWCYDLMEKDTASKDHVNKMIWQQRQFIEAEELKEEKDLEKLAMAYYSIGEGYLRNGFPQKAVENLTKASKELTEQKKTDQLELAQIQLKLAKAKLALMAAEYTQSAEMLEELILAISNLDKSKLDFFYEKYVQRLLEDSKKLLAHIESKPEVILTVDQPELCEKDSVLTLTGTIANQGGQDVTAIVFKANIPIDFEVVAEVDTIDVLKAGESAKISFKITPKIDGVFDLKSLEVLYHDQDKKQYMKSSNIITLNVREGIKEVTEAEKKSQQTKSDVYANKIFLLLSGDDNPIIMVTYNTVEHSQAILAVLNVLKNMKKFGGVYLSFGNPYENLIELMIKNSISTDDILFIDCISPMAGRKVEANSNVVFVENPSSLEEISMHVDNMLSNVKNERKFLVIDSLSSLLIYNEEKPVEEMVHFIINKLRIQKITAIILSTIDDYNKPVVKTVLASCDKGVTL